MPTEVVEDAAAVRRLRPAGAAWRAVVTAAALVALGLGQWVDTNDYFPFGSLSQYATPRDLDGTVSAVYLVADTAEERDVRVSLDQRVVGVGRAEVEGQLPRLEDQPSLLQSLADAYHAMHPDRPRLRELRLLRETQQLRDGYVVGEPASELLVTWTVEDER